jgi:hypothetical protein
MSKGMLLKTVREEIGPARADNLAKLKRAELAAACTRFSAWSMPPSEPT